MMLKSLKSQGLDLLAQLPVLLELEACIAVAAQDDGVVALGLVGCRRNGPPAPRSQAPHRPPCRRPSGYVLPTPAAGLRLEDDGDIIIA